MNQQINILFAPITGSLTDRLTHLQTQLENYLLQLHATTNDILWCRIYFSDAANQLSVFANHPLCTQALAGCACSYIEQPPLNGAKVALVLGVLPQTPMAKEGTPSQMKVTCNGATWLLHSVRLTLEEAEGLDARQQTELCFNKHIAWLEANNMTLKDNCIRTWLYVRDIDTNYAAVMKGRNAIFAAQGLTTETHFIASTGIEGNTDQHQVVIAIDFMSAAFEVDPQIEYLQALDYLNPTHEYGVAFERGVSFKTATAKHAMLSGTASIDCHGKCLYIGDIEKQTERMFINMEQLLLTAGSSLKEIPYLIVYLRDVADYEWVSKYMENRFPQVPCIIMKAPVCRPAWLIEAETFTIQNI